MSLPGSEAFPGALLSPRGPPGPDPDAERRPGAGQQVPELCLAGSGPGPASAAPGSPAPQAQGFSAPFTALSPFPEFAQPEATGNTFLLLPVGWLAAGCAAVVGIRPVFSWMMFLIIYSRAVSFSKT